MANKDFYKASDIPQFQEDICKKKCVCNEHCIEEGKDNQSFLMCPLYHAWKLGYWSFVWDQILWEREHPDEAAAKQQAKVEAAKKWKAEQKAKSEKKDKKKEAKK